MDTPMILARAIHFASAISLTGILAFLVLIADPALRQAGADGRAEAKTFRDRLMRLAWWSLAVALVSGIVWLVLQAKSMSGQSLSDVFSRGIVATVLTQTQFGRVWDVRLVLAILLIITLLGEERRRRGGTADLLRRVGLALSAGLVAAIAWAGHAGAGKGWPGAAHLTADILHLLAAAAWLGALVPLAWLFACARRAGDPGWATVARTATSRFSTLGLLSVGTLLVTGVVNGWFLVGTLPALIGTDYGHLLLIKLGLFAMMVALAAVNRRRLTPHLSPPQPGDDARTRWIAIRQLQRNASLEAALGAVILLVVGALGNTPPALHVQPWWPLPYRPSLDEIGELPELLANPVATAAVAALGLALVSLAIIRRRRRGLALLAGLVLLAGAGWEPLRLLAVEAYPTSFYRPAVPLTAASVMRGAKLYAENCAACHGPDGRGDGLAAAGLNRPPADLTAEHIFEHTDGDLFWWISHGIADGPMPGFADALDERQRWEVINFIHAHAAGVQSSDMSAEVTAFPAPAAPDFSFERRDGRQGTLAAEHSGHAVLLVFFTAPASLPRLAQLAAWRDDLSGMGLSVLAISARDPTAADEGAPAPLLDLIVTTGGDVSGAYALFERRSRRALARPPAGHKEFLIDSNGYVRTRWQPGDLPDWGDVATLRMQMDRLARLPLAPMAHGGHVH